MDPASLLSAREYVCDCAAKNVMAISPVSLSRRISCTADEACAVLYHFHDVEHLVELNAFVTCPACDQDTALKRTSREDIEREAAALAEAPCRYCQAPLPEKGDLEVRLRFFPSELAKSSADSRPSRDVEPNADPQDNAAALSLRALHGVLLSASALNIHADRGSQVVVGASSETIVQAQSEKQGAGPPARVQPGFGVRWWVPFVVAATVTLLAVLLWSDPWAWWTWTYAAFVIVLGITYLFIFRAAYWTRWLAGGFASLAGVAGLAPTIEAKIKVDELGSVSFLNESAPVTALGFGLLSVIFAVIDVWQPKNRLSERGELIRCAND